MEQTIPFKGLEGCSQPLAINRWQLTAGDRA